MCYHGRQTIHFECDTRVCDPRRAQPSRFTGRQYVYSPSTTDLHLSLSSFGETAGAVAFQSIEVMRPNTGGTTCAAQHSLAVAGTGTSDDPRQLYDDDEANHVVDLTSGLSDWNPARATATPSGWPRPPMGSWLGEAGVNPLLDYAHQGEQPMPMCRDGGHSFELEWSLTDAQATCGALDLELWVVGSLGTVWLNGVELAARQMPGIPRDRPWLHPLRYPGEGLLSLAYHPFTPPLPPASPAPPFPPPLPCALPPLEERLKRCIVTRRVEFNILPLE